MIHAKPITLPILPFKASATPEELQYILIVAQISGNCHALHDNAKNQCSNVLCILNWL